MKINIKDWQILWFFFRQYKMQSLGVLISMAVSGFMDMLNLAALYPIINYGLGAENKNVVLEHFEKATQYIAPSNSFFASCVILVIVSLLAFIAKMAYSYCSSKLSVRMIGDTQKKVFDTLIAADYSFYVSKQQGTLIYAGTTACERVSLMLLNFNVLIHSLLTALFLFLLLVLLSWQATCLIVLITLLYAATIRKVKEQIVDKCARISVEENQRKNVILNEFIAGIKPIKVFWAFEAWKKRYAGAVNKGMENQFRMLVGRAFPEMLVKAIFFIMIAVAGMFLSQRPQEGIVTLLPVLGTFAVVVNRFMPLSHLIGKIMMVIAEYIPDAHIVRELCTMPFSSTGGGSRQWAGLKEKIRFDGMWFKYDGMEENLLRNISFTLEKQRMTALVGLSGAGKTTIINLLLKLYRPSKGRILADDMDIIELNDQSYLSRIGYVGQETFIFNDSIKENIRFGMENCTDAMIEEAAKLANAHEFIMETPQGYDTLVGDAGVKISGGQRQRLAIARAMLRKPEIIVLDEATSSLDNISEQRIQAAINNISKHTTVLVIAHRLSTVRPADKIIILDKGEVKEQGTHEELMKKKNLYYVLQQSGHHADEAIINEEIGRS